MWFPYQSLEEKILHDRFGASPEKLAEAEERLSRHEPLAYILGETVFFKENYRVTPAVLIPRPDTERLVEAILRRLPENGSLLELCTGSGCISISTLCHSRGTRALAVDVSPEALSVAEKNAARNRVSGRLRLLRGDLFTMALWDRLAGEGPFDLVAANPPYIASEVLPTLEPECAYEPQIALDGGADGMDFYKVILPKAKDLLKREGRMLLEIGYDQKAKIEVLAEANGLFCTVTKDWGGNDRVAELWPKEA